VACPDVTATSEVGTHRRVTLQDVRARGRVRTVLSVLGPAFVASVAYIDPGNFATNFAAGAGYGYELVWVIAMANLMAILVAVPHLQGWAGYRAQPAGTVSGAIRPASESDSVAAGRNRRDGD
jgi:hypothetical protein